MEFRLKKNSGYVSGNSDIDQDPMLSYTTEAHDTKNSTLRRVLREGGP